MSKKEFYVLDSLQFDLKKQEEDCHKYLTEFIAFLRDKRNRWSPEKIDVNGWKAAVAVSYTHQTEKVEFNCGVFVLWYMFQILQNRELTESMDPLYFRKVLISHLYPPIFEVNKKLRDEKVYPHPLAQFMSGLLCDCDYYCGTPEVNTHYVVCRFRNKSIYKDEVLLTGYDYASLKPGKWLSGTVLDGCLSAILGDYHHVVDGKSNFETIYRIFKTDFTVNLVSKNFKASVEVGYRVGLLPFHEDVEWYIFPLNLEGIHWTVLFVNLKAGSYQYYDSLERSDNSKIDVTTLVKNFAENYNTILCEKEKIKHTEWKDESINEYAKQTDSYNCGLFVISYIHRLVFGEYNSVQGMRERMQTKLLHDSYDMTEVCLYCGCGITPLSYRRKKPVEWVLCSCCRRWIHLTCIKNAPSFENLKMTFDFKCILCEKITPQPISPPKMNTIEQPIENPLFYYEKEIYEIIEDVSPVVSEISVDLSF